LESEPEAFPLISICVPVLNGSKYLTAALNSALCQTYRNFELLISDNGSTDSSREIVENLEIPSDIKVRVFENSNSGISNNCNFLVEKSKGKFIKFLFQDDILCKNNLEKLLTNQNSFDNVGLVFSKREVILDDRSSLICRQIFEGGKDVHIHWTKIENFQSGLSLLEDPNLLKQPLNKVGEPSNTLILKDAFLKVGGFDQDLLQMLDLDLWYKIFSSYNVVFVDEYLSYFRVHRNQASVRNIELNIPRREFLHIFKSLILNNDYSSIKKEARAKLLGHFEGLLVDLAKYQNKEEIKKAVKENKEEIKKAVKENKKEIKKVVKENKEEIAKIKTEFKENIFLLNGQISNLKDKISFMRSTLSWKVRKVVVTKFYNKFFLQRTTKSKIKIGIQPESLYSNEFEFKTHNIPQVSIIIPVFNNYEFTLKCIGSIKENTDEKLNYEIILIDDNSSDQTSELSQISGIKYVRNSLNHGFLYCCNLGIELSVSKYVVFLNNDTQVSKGWLTNLLTLFNTSTKIGAIGAKLVYPNGVLQEAGGFIWADATGCNYGKGDDANNPKYNFVREVDYASGACLVVPRKILCEVGNFSEEFSPAYYEDTDLCFKIRSQGYKVLYQPQSIIYHHEGLTCGVNEDVGVKKYQKINREKFLKKWEKALARHPCSLGNKEAQYLYSIRKKPEEVILIIDSYLPRFDREAGSKRIFEIIKILKSLGMHVVFLPSNLYAEDPYYTHLTNDIGVEVLACKNWKFTIKEILNEKIPTVKYIWICRPEIFKKFYPLVCKKNKIIIYDSIDLHYLRTKREWELGGRKSFKLFLKWTNYYLLERKSARRATMVFSVTKPEAEFFKNFNSASYVIPTIHSISERKINPFNERDGLLFIGGYNHKPNVDAAKWLCKTIMPLIWKQNPEISLTLLGSDPPQEVINLQSSKIFVPGYIANVSSFFNSSKVFVSPLRFGAGMKGKIGHSLSFGLPVVMTQISAEGMNMRNGYNGFITDDIKMFSKYILRLYLDENVWNYISKNSIEHIKQYSSSSVSLIIKDILN
tara:strand:- start:4764 stop:7874 length:3111 start_codon:yes stop_codon:yes gene_type:complete